MTRKRVPKRRILKRVPSKTFFFIVWSSLCLSVVYSFLYIQHKQGNLLSSESHSSVLGTTPWYGNYVYRKQITIDHTKVNGTLSNFPVLISLTDPSLKTSSNGGFIQNSMGYDIVFTAADGITKLDHEIEKYVLSTGEIVMWVRLPTLSNSSDTSLFMYFDNNSVSSSQENKAGVWDSSYKGVWHLQETGNGFAGEYKDSTANGNNGRGGAGISSQIPTVTTGKLEKAQHFTRSSSQYISVPDSSSVNITTRALSIEYWAYFTGVPTDDFATIGKVGYDRGYRSLYTNNREAQFQLTGQNGYNVYSSTLLNTGLWNHVVDTYDGTTMKQYINGKVDANTYTRTTAIDDSTGADLQFGSGSSQYFTDGNLQEVRISNIARSDSWIATEYNNQNAPATFYSLSAQQINVPTPTNTTPPSPSPTQAPIVPTNKPLSPTPPPSPSITVSSGSTVTPAQLDNFFAPDSPTPTPELIQNLQQNTSSQTTPQQNSNPLQSALSFIQNINPFQNNSNTSGVQPTPVSASDPVNNKLLYDEAHYSPNGVEFNFAKDTSQSSPAKPSFFSFLFSINDSIKTFFSSLAHTLLHRNN